MKKLKYSKRLIGSLIVGAFVFLSSCSDNEDNLEPFVPEEDTSKLTIGAELKTYVWADSLSKALVIGGLNTTVQSSGTFTLFAPNNQAFLNLLASKSHWNSLSDIGSDTLANVLKYHMIGSIVSTADLSGNAYLLSLNTQGSHNETTVIEIDSMPRYSLNDTALFVDSNIVASNGLIHQVNQLMIPPNACEMVRFEERLAMFNDAMDIFGDTVSGELKKAGSITLFAPSNGAFQSLLDGNTSWNTLFDIPRAELKGILLHHIGSSNNFQTDQFVDGQTINTLGASSLSINNGSSLQVGTTASSNAPANLMANDIQSINGVIHIIDKVLMP